MLRHPTPPPQEAERYYRQTYGYLFLSQAETPARTAMFRSLLKRLGPAGGRRLLDIGAGSGLFVRMAREAGWSADGTELSEAHRAWASSQHGIKLYDPKAAPPANADYDVVTLINVLDQAPDPVRLLEISRRALRPGGRLLVRVPNAAFHIRWVRVTSAVGLKGLARRAIIHPYAFDPGSLRRVLHSREFRVLGLRNATLARAPSARRLPGLLGLATSLGSVVLSLGGRHLLWAPSIEALAEIPSLSANP
jgi:SAM-dependent methyltransferase